MRRYWLIFHGAAVTKDIWAANQGKMAMGRYIWRGEGRVKGVGEGGIYLKKVWKINSQLANFK